MKNYSTEIRRTMGCGYEPALEMPQSVWAPPSGDVGYQWAMPKICAAYTCGLPEVLETAINRIHWSKGHDQVAGEPMTEDTLNGVVILEGAYNDLHRWILTPSKEGGGGR